MSEAGWAALRRMLVDEYEALRRRLASRVGSDAARDALQDTFLQLAREGEGADDIRDPRRYLFRMAMNLAKNRLRTEQRRLDILGARRLEAALEIPDDQPGPVEIAEARSDLARLRQVLEEMPPRRREMVLAVLVEGVTHRELADRYQLSMRMIQIEMKKATNQIAERFGSAKIIRFAFKPPVTSDP